MKLMVNVDPHFFFFTNTYYYVSDFVQRFTIYKPF